MKYIIILGDGMADYPCPELAGETPLEIAFTPRMDAIAHLGESGFAVTVPDSLKPGSDVANLSVFGYDPLKYYTGRSPLEAISMGIDISPNDLAFRCNLVCLSDDKNYEDKIMIDYSSDEISTEESKQLIALLNEKLPEKLDFFNDNFKLYPGISYRHCLIWNKPSGDFQLTPPHDITTKKVTDHLPNGSGTPMLYKMMKASYDILKDAEVNKKRIAAGKRPANSMWIWGEGKKPMLPSFKDLYGKTGAVVSAVDLIKGIAICAGLEVINVEGATGNVNTNFLGKGEAALKALLDGKDFVYVHVEAPDESGHRNELDNKVDSIESIDKYIIATIEDGLHDAGEDYRILVTPDHPTPLSLRTHTRDAVPFALYDSRKLLYPHGRFYSEKFVNKENVVKGTDLIKKLFAE